jgi:hypothetical protein
MEQKLKQINHDVRNLIPIQQKDIDLLSQNNVDNKKLLVLIHSLNDALKYLTETFLTDEFNKK